MRNVPYIYRHLPIGGGGYVTGFIFHPTQRDLLYARTDIGGMYRFDPYSQEWVSLIDHVTPLDLSQAFPISAAVDPARPERLYVACGERHLSQGTLAVSEDYGDTFRCTTIPVRVHGNLNGRGTGERLLLSREDDSTLIFASQLDGLLISRDLGESWEAVDALPERALTFAAQPCAGVLLVGSAGLERGVPGVRRGPSLYVSYDGGASFAVMEQPKDPRVPGTALLGHVAQRWAADERYVYVTFAATGRNSYIQDVGYSNDSGDSECGRIVRYPIGNDGRLGAMEDITPPFYADTQFGFSGLSACPARSGLLAASSICREEGDFVCVSEDRGENWRVVMCDLQIGRMEFRLPYMRPCCNAGRSIVHWMSDFAIDPFDPRCAWFNTGTGVFRTQNLLDDEVIFCDWCDGIEETVHLNVYAPTDGRNQVIDIIGDLGGFAFEQLDQHCLNSFADDDGNRYITCMNADFRDEAPDHVIVTPRGNWKGYTKGGLIVSHDGCVHFDRLPMPYGLDTQIDALLARIERPNVNAGWCALSADGGSIVWAVGDGDNLPAQCLIRSGDGGASFARCHVTDMNGQPAQGLMKPFADRCDSSLFYGFGEAGQLYVSRDGGRSFAQKEAPDGFPAVNMGLVDCRNKTEIRVESGACGVIWLALGAGGLWRLQYDQANDRFCGRRVSAPEDVVFRMGLGLGRPGGDYIHERKRIYFSGIVGGMYGFYSMNDDGSDLARLNTARQMYGEINSMDGDCRVYGRFYLATGSSGLLYGDITEAKEEEVAL
ncbi:MAG: endoglucanase [Clostridia bacterium]|nr:endoglucanase [Clostridia bacterium]